LLDYDRGEVRLEAILLTDALVDPVNSSIVLRFQQKNRSMVFNRKIETVGHEGCLLVSRRSRERNLTGSDYRWVFAPFKAVSAISGAGTVTFSLARLPDG
jgi:hypothetical protein